MLAKCELPRYLKIGRFKPSHFASFPCALIFSPGQSKSPQRTFGYVQRVRYRAIVDELIEVPEAADTRDTEAVKRIATAYLKLLFPQVRNADDISAREFKRYCLDRARKMRDTIKYQLGILDVEYRRKDIPAFSVRPDSEEVGVIV